MRNLKFIIISAFWFLIVILDSLLICHYIENLSARIALILTLFLYSFIFIFILIRLKKEKRKKDD